MNPPQQALLSVPQRHRALLDGDILIELFYNRGGFVEEIESFLDSLAKLNDSTFYITDKALRQFEVEHIGQCVLLQSNLEHIDESELRVVTNYFRKLFDNNTITVTHSIVQKARKLGFPDFDSAIEHICALEYELDAIITQNPSNFPNTKLAVIPLKDIATSLSYVYKMATDLSQAHTAVQELKAQLHQRNPIKKEATDRNIRVSIEDWLENIFEQGWQPLESLLPHPSTPHFR